MASRSTPLRAIRTLAATAAILVGGLAVYTGAQVVTPDHGKPAASITLAKLALSGTEATGFDAYTARSSTLPTGAGFFIYAEARNLATAFDGERVNGRVAVDVLIANDRGETIIAQQNVWQVSFEIASKAHRSIDRAWLSLAVAPMDLPEGHYEMTLRVHDTIGGTHADRRIDIAYRRPAEVAAVLVTARR